MFEGTRCHLGAKQRARYLGGSNKGLDEISNEMQQFFVGYVQTNLDIILNNSD